MKVTRADKTTSSVPTYNVKLEEGEEGAKLVDLLVAIGAAPNKAHARHLIASGAVQISKEELEANA